MALGRVVMCGATAVALLALPACGKRFPFGERLLPESYGPPFGSALKDLVPKHPHNPASEERHAAADAEENRTYASHAACNAAMRAAFARHAAGHGAGGHGGGHGAAQPAAHGSSAGGEHQSRAAQHGGAGNQHGNAHSGSSHAAGHGPGTENPHGPVAISSIESVGHYTAGDTIHEYRCSNYTLSYRAWHPEGAAHGSGGHGQEH